ncbi:MAG: heme o synthase [Candidatus Sericytochromatia bacterium]|nr:heme o synthase [Candidatus Sericytochromatia bacterium]
MSDVALYRRFTRLAWLTIALIVAQVLLGSTVRATGSGMGCPDWPLCHGQWLPAMNFESILEYGHRLVGAIVSATLVGMSGWVLLNQRLRERLGRLVGLTLVLIVSLVTFGAVTVAYDMPPAVVATHLELAALLLITWVTAAQRGRESLHGAGEAPRPGVYRWLVLATTVACFGQLFLGAMVSVSHAGLACPDFPTCYGMWVPPLIGNVGVQVVHRLGALTVAACVFLMVVAVELQGGGRVRRWARLAGLLVIAQIGLGAATVLAEIPPALSVAHLAIGMTLFVVLYLAVYACFPRLGDPGGRGQTAALAAEDSEVVATLRPLAWRQALGAYYQLTKPTIVMLVVLTGLPALIIAARGSLGWGLALAALVGTAGAAGSAAVFNQYFERERDRQMVRTAARPIPAGLVAPAHALVFAILLGVASLALLAWQTTWLATAIAAFSLLFYGFFYTLVLKGSSPQNIVIGGAAGASAPLICWAAVTGSLDWAAWVMFAIIFFWTPPHFWALAIYRLDDYVAARVPMFPVVYGVTATARWIAIYTLMLVPLSLFLVPLGAAGPIYFFSAVLLGLGFLALALKVVQTEARRDATRLFAYSIVYTLVLFSCLTLDAALGGPQLVAAHLAGR